MKASIILKRAKERMQDEGYTSSFICDNIWHVTRGEPDGNKDNDRITQFIEELLGGRFSLVEWLIDMGHIKAVDSSWSHDQNNYLGDLDRIKLQATRMAWLDHLIAHYESQGD